MSEKMSLYSLGSEMLFTIRSWMYSRCIMDVVLKEHVFIQRWFSTFLLNFMLWIATKILIFYFLHILRGISLFMLFPDRFNLYPICYHSSEKYIMSLFIKLFILRRCDVVYITNVSRILENWEDEGGLWKISTETHK